MTTTRYITTEKTKYLIRGPYKPQELKILYQKFQDKYHSKLTFKQWLVDRGKVHFRIKARIN